MPEEALFSEDSRIFVAGHRGLVGSAICRRLARAGFSNLILKTRAELDLRNQAAVDSFFETERPAYVFLAAAKVGGILANSTYPAEFIYDNLALQTNVIHAAWKYGAAKLLFLGSSCVYPKLAPQPMREEHLLTSALEPTNEWYAVAKIAGIKLAQAYRRQFGIDFISVMPTNLYGPGDNYHPENSHVPAALIRRFHEAKLANAPHVSVWGSGNPKREFLAVDDLGDACVFIMKHYSDDQFLNAGTGREVSIREFAEIVADVVGYRGKLAFDTSRPDGTPRKLLDVSKLAALGWRAGTPLREGLQAAYADFLAHKNSLRER